MTTIIVVKHGISDNKEEVKSELQQAKNFAGRYGSVFFVDSGMSNSTEETVTVHVGDYVKYFSPDGIVVSGTVTAYDRARYDKIYAKLTECSDPSFNDVYVPVAHLERVGVSSKAKFNQIPGQVEMEGL